MKRLSIKNGLLILSSLLFMVMVSCQEKYQKGTFGYDFEQLQAIEDIEILQDGDAMIAVSGTLQGRIFTSSANGLKGKSYGWFNQELIDKNQHTTNIANLGGESRLWFAPEFGQFSLCFEKDAEQVDANMFRPYDLQNKKFSIIQRSQNTLTVGGQMTLKNAENFVFIVDVERTISLLSKTTVEDNLGIHLSEKIGFVGFNAENKVTNISREQFKKETGLISIWELGCMLTSPDNFVIIPLSQPTDSITEYFTPIADRMQIQNQTVFYKADAQGVNKIGILPQFCKNVMASFSPSNNQLNIVIFSFEKDSLYVNSLPENTTPYQGDVINIFNGEVNPDLDRNWAFYEFESSSSAKELKPDEQLFHSQTTYHFEGNFEELNQITKAVLGISLNDIPDF